MPSGTATARRVLASRTLPMYLAAGSVFAALSARAFIIPLQAHQLAANRAQIGLLFSVATVSGALLSIPSGLLADRLGRPVLLLGGVLAGGGSQVGLAFSNGIEPYYFWQAVGGLAAGASQAALFAAVADAVPPARLGRAMGWITMSMQLGFLGGPAVAGLAVHFLTLREDMLATALFYVVALAVALTRIPSAPAQGPNRWELVRPIREIVVQPSFAPVALGLFGATLLWGTLQAYQVIFAKESLALPETQIGFMVALQALSNGLSRIAGGWLIDRIGRLGLVVVPGMILFAGSVALLPHLKGFWPVTLLLVLSVPLLATTFIAVAVGFGALANPRSRGVAMGFYGSILYLGLAVGPAAFGPIMQDRGYVAGFTACAVVSTVLALLVALAGWERLQSRWRGRQLAASAGG